MSQESPPLETAVTGAILGTAAGIVALVACDGLAWPLILLAATPLVVRSLWRSMPLWVLLTATVVPVLLAEAVQDRATSATWLIGCVALVVVTIHRDHPAEWIAVAAVVCGPFLLLVTGAVNHEAAVTAIWTMGLLLSATGGTIIGQQRRLVLSMQESQATLAAAAAADERHRIARDVHDLVGHSFSVVLLHLSGARHLIRTDPDKAEAALLQAEEVGRQSMNDLRSSLTLLRSDDPSRAPVGSLSALPDLVDGMRRAGLDVSFSSRGELVQVDPAVGVVVHSVAREALTNAAKHAAEGPVLCDVEVGDRVVLTVSNRTAAGAPTTAPGLGLAGMEERVRAIGGSVDASRHDGEWTVVVDVPLHTPRTTP